MKNALLRLLAVIAVFTMILGTAGPTVLGQTPVASPVASPEASPVASPVAEEDILHGIQIADMDLSVDPGDDFYQFATGGWSARNEIPADSPVFGVSDEVNDRVEAQLITVMEGLDTDPTTPQGKARLLYDQVLDTETRNEQGIDPIRPILDDIQAITTIEEGLAFQEASDSLSLVGLFAPFASASPTDATTNIAWLFGPYLSLPSADYYTDESEEGVAIRDAWLSTTTQLLMQLGYTEQEAATAAQVVLEFETELAAAKTPDEVLFSDPSATNNPRTLDELQEMFPSFDWTAFVEKTDLPDDVDTINVMDIAYLEALEGLLAGADPLTLQYVFATQLIWDFSSYLTTDIEDIAFSFQGPILFGVEEQEPADETALLLVESMFTDTIGEAYVDVAFSAEAKAQVEELANNIIAAFRIRIEESTWMSEETKLKALEKLDLMNVKVGYPDKWEAYDNVEVGESLFETYTNAYQAGNEKSLGEIGQPVDRDLWYIGAYEVNAYYDRSLNEFVFPAAILQAPYFDPEADLASNYGAIGAVIGHELTHGFDISGSQYDGYGNLVSWWTEDDFAAFSALNDEVVAQYAAIEVLPGLMVDGELTVTENVADMGGVQVAYDAMLIALNADGQENQPWFLTQQQRFFVAFANSWREMANPEFLEFLVASDEHAPSSVRAVEPVRHMDEFYDAFDIEPGDPEYLAPEDRIVIW